MKGVKELKARLSSVGNIRKVTSTMELVAGAKMKKLQERAMATRPYAQAIRAMMGQVAQFAPGEVSPLLRQPDQVSRECVIVIAADKGLCGAFNTNVFRKAMEYIRRRMDEGVEVSVYTFGNRSEKFFAKVKMPFVGKLEEKLEGVGYRRVAATMRSLSEDFVSDRFQRISLVRTELVSAARFEPSIQTVLPFTAEAMKGDESEVDRNFDLDYLMEPSPKVILERLIPKTLEMSLLSAVHESLAAEFAARRIAMKNATDSATEMIDELRMEYNKARQAGITGELLEITAGAEALKG
ncbi:MAG: ATP synthase F1 subunit gamma [Planctomycetota bacterium]